MFVSALTERVTRACELHGDKQNAEATNEEEPPLHEDCTVLPFHFCIQAATRKERLIERK